MIILLMVLLREASSYFSPTGFMGEEEWLKTHTITVEVLQNKDCIRIMTDFIATRPKLWNEDIGV